ncbi:MAG: cupin domain-containing protein [Firmicutes bacterium]|nr:cupin domain-containing protein [Bacillota bacterium]
MIRFEEVETKMLHEFRGGTGVAQMKMVVDDNNKIICGRLEKGCSIGEHAHEVDSEIIYVISGEAKFTLDGETEICGPGQVHYCPQGSSHSTANNGEEDLVFFAVVPVHTK